MKALVKAERAEGLVMRDEPKPEIGTDDILIKVAKTGICGTDLHIWKWDEWAQKTIPVPMVVGHEFAGVVAEVGTHVRTVKVGDRVSGEGHLIGMKSRMARAGHFHLDP
ncbi:MAG TPA: alcohol dehydrogenase catalytic domain-containing protein, partial [Aestuariivirga sp.]